MSEPDAPPATAADDDMGGRCAKHKVPPCADTENPAEGGEQNTGAAELPDALGAAQKDLGVDPVLAVPLLQLPCASAEAMGTAAEDSTPLLVLSQGSVVRFSGDAVVNAANTGCVGGGGVDWAISEAGGKALEDARYALPTLDEQETRCPTGDAKRTIGGDLNAKWCVHAVGPNYILVEDDGEPLEVGDQLLHSAYASAMRRAEEVKAATIGFALLSAGIFRGPKSLEDVLEIGIRAIREGAYAELREVHLVAFTEHEMDALEEALRRVWFGAGDTAV